MSGFCIHQIEHSPMLITCSLIKSLTGTEIIPGRNRPGYICNMCKDQWKNNEPPSSGNLTPVVEELIFKGFVSKPSFKEKVSNLATSAVKIITSFGATVSQSVFEERIAICSGCDAREKNQYGEWTGGCNACGCNMFIKSKFVSMECPLNKWPVPSGNSSGGCGCK